MEEVTLSLISHTNVGKTTLARTLLRRDVGEVLDQAHVTEEAERFTLIETPDARLALWDTPGFGDSASLMKLLRRQREPLGWLLHQTWDRVVDRPLYCSQRAARNVRDEADIVLYLVNASEDPSEAGYVGLELELLTWIGRPVVLLLNQIGSTPRSAETGWRDFVEAWPIVGDVLSLDAFTRCWVEENVLFLRVGALLDGPRRRSMEQLAAAWSRRNLTVFQSSVEQLSTYLATAAADRETARSGSDDDGGGETLRLFRDALKFASVDRRRAMKALGRRLDRATNVLMAGLIAGHGLEGDSAAKIEKRVQDFQVHGGGIPLNERSGALAGAVVSGALSGLAADALSGGLTLGGGMIAGGILGALGGAVLGKGYRMVGGGAQPTVRWASEFLDHLLEQAILRYLAVAHFGRGRGRFREIEFPAHWSVSVEAALSRRQHRIDRLWALAREERDPDEARLRGEAAAIFEAAIRDVLREAYPHAARLLES